MRTDIPPRLFRQLLMQASEVVQKRLLAQAKPETQAEIRKVLANAEVLIVDEAHHLSAPNLYAACFICPAYYRFGLSATLAPTRNAVGSMKMFAALGGVIKFVRVAATVQAQYVAMPYAVMLPYETPLREESSAAYDYLYRRHVVNHEQRNLAIVKACDTLLRQGRRLLVVVRDVQHGHATILHEMLEKLGWKTPVLTGANSPQEREEVQKLLQSGQINGIVASTIYDEGKNVPDLGAVVLAAAGYSPVKLLQRLGRTMRQKADQKSAVLVDFQDRSHDVFWKHSRIRAKTLTTAGIITFVGWEFLDKPTYCEAEARKHFKLADPVN